MYQSVKCEGMVSGTSKISKGYAMEDVAEAKSAIPTLSLFSGAGGLDLGFSQANYEIKAFVEINKSYCDTLHKNARSDAGHFERSTVHCCDIRNFDTKPYRDVGIRCVIGGPPCQTFSAAGRRSGGVIGTEDERGQLFQAYCRIIREVAPEIFVFENVYGLPGANGGKPWKEILGEFSELGFKLKAEVVDAADYGVPQHRERLIMVGYKSGHYSFPLPTHGPDSPSGADLMSVEQAIEDLQNADEPYHNNLGGLYGHLLPLVPEGLNYSFFTSEMGHPEPVFAWRSKFHDLLYKADKRQPCRTIKAQPGKFTGPFHWKNRHFTIPELKRLQTFPDAYEIAGGYTKVLEQVGNSVPPRLAYIIARSVREQLIDEPVPATLPTRSVDFRSTFRQRQRQRTHDFDKVAKEAIEQQYKVRKSAPVAIQGESVVESYLLNPRSLFDRAHLRVRNEALPGLPIYDVRVTEHGKQIDIVFSSQIEAGGRAHIEISGLRKYIPEFDTLTLVGNIAKLDDVFHAWGAVEEALTRRSGFFTLIDIYGHYANRGDSVKIKGCWRLFEDPALVRTLNLFSSSAACGDFLENEALHRSLGIEKGELSPVVKRMREARFDLRSSKTHPILGVDRVLCTYPFPLLSPRALVESRVQLTPPATKKTAAQGTMFL